MLNNYYFIQIEVNSISITISVTEQSRLYDILLQLLENDAQLMSTTLCNKVSLNFWRVTLVYTFLIPPRF
jgi:hypothetical protein